MPAHQTTDVPLERSHVRRQDARQILPEPLLGHSLHVGAVEQLVQRVGDRFLGGRGLCGRGQPGQPKVDEASPVQEAKGVLEAGGCQPFLCPQRCT